jgi:hypothetical protein
MRAGEYLAHFAEADTTSSVFFLKRAVLNLESLLIYVCTSFNHHCLSDYYSRVMQY